MKWKRHSFWWAVDCKVAIHAVDDAATLCLADFIASSAENSINAVNMQLVVAICSYCNRDAFA